ncbi:MAG: type IV secretory system conjugative DNA transfer family protein [Agrobacterium cavarae]
MARLAAGKRACKQIVFASGNPPLRCGRAIYFRRKEMIDCVDDCLYH